MSPITRNDVKSRGDNGSSAATRSEHMFPINSRASVFIPGTMHHEEKRPWGSEDGDENDEERRRRGKYALFFNGHIRFRETIPKRQLSRVSSTIFALG